MPSAFPMPCARAGCPRIVRGKRYCESHAHLEKPKPRRRDEPLGPRGKTAERGYDAKWQKISKRRRIEQPWCEICFDHKAAVERLRAAGSRYRPPRTRKLYTAAEVVDHMKRIADGGGNEDSNLMCLCSRCHNAKSAWERHNL